MQQEKEERARALEEDGEDAEQYDQAEEEFDEELIINEFNDENPPIDIPPEIVDDIDNDYNLIDEDDEHNE
jgi:hypothetical protein